MMKIGFFGGSFNPPTIAHFKIVKTAIQEFGLDKLVIIPMGDKYEKSELVSFNLRFEMLKESFKSIPNVEISDMQANQVHRVYAIESFKEINKLYNNSENYFIMGLDNYSKIDNWKGAEELLNDYKYIVFKRNNIDIPKFSKNAYFLDISSDISSRNVRDMIKNKENLTNILDKNVIDYIDKNNLYKEK